MEPARRRTRLILAATTAGAALWLALAASPVLALARPLQAAVLQWLMPEFTVERIGLETATGSLRLSARAVTREHVVLRGRVFAPGLAFEAHTPARQTQRLAVMTLLACALCWNIGMAPRWRSTLAIACVGLAATLVTAPVVLAGQMWSTVVAGLDEPSLRAVLVECSRFVLHGGDMALVVIFGMVLSDHARPRAGRIMRGPADAGMETPARRPA
ncbi:hypothetical protein [Variovorax sp. YR752]|uniref:hypothetical protein n=1 Tax=Variovorax sp. YR752 TaxID=1884383 RepID=UPI0031378F61